MSVRQSSSANALMALTALSGCALFDRVPTAKLAQARLRLAEGHPAGTALLSTTGDQVTITIAGLGLPAGAHGLHLHMLGKCEAPGFISAGGHLNPGGHQHGTANPQGSHLGDLPNLEVDRNGVGTLAAPLRGTRADVEAALFDADGTAIVIHATADDYRTDPTGNSGTRIACGVLTK